MTIVLIILATFSGIGMAFIFVRLFLLARRMSEEELVEALRSSKPTFSEFHNAAIILLLNFWEIRVIPSFYGVTERLISRVEILVRKFDSRLSRIRDYIHGKTHPRGNGGSEYWNNINNFKDNLKNE